MWTITRSQTAASRPPFHQVPLQASRPRATVHKRRDVWPAFAALAPDGWKAYPRRDRANKQHPCATDLPDHRRRSPLDTAPVGDSIPDRARAASLETPVVELRGAAFLAPASLALAAGR